MDELKGPTIQIVLNVKEGLGFGFLRSPFVVTGSLNGYILETDPVVPAHAPIFDAELVWEADKRRFRSLRVQNVPVKVEVFTSHTEGRKEKVGYLLLSLLGAQPCPASRVVDVKHTWHRLLGIKSEGKCCHPQLLMSLSIEDRVSTPTPRNELRMFHTNEIAYPTSVKDHLTTRPMLLTVDEYMAESKKTVSSPDLHPKLICDEGLIQIGNGNRLFVLGVVIGSVENIDLLLPSGDNDNEIKFVVSYSVFTHNITTDRVGIKWSGRTGSAQFNVRTSLRLRTELPQLARYFAECPHMVTALRAGDTDLGICSLDLRKLVPTEDVNDFANRYCNEDNALTIHERCFLLRCQSTAQEGSRRPFVDVDLSLQYVGVKAATQTTTVKSARSATHLRSARGDAVTGDAEAAAADLQCRSGSDTQLRGAPSGAYTNILPANTNRYTNAAGDAVLQTNDIAEMIKKMYESFTLSQEKILAEREIKTAHKCESGGVWCGREKAHVEVQVQMPDAGTEPEPVASKSDTCLGNNEKVIIQKALSGEDRASLIHKCVVELEDWKEKQQELFKYQLIRKEEYHLDLLAKEWSKRREELERKLSTGIEQCRNLAADLSRATDDFRLKGFRNTEREKKLLEAKKTLEAHFTAKYQELREASQKMEDDMNHRLKLKDMTIEELQLQVQHLEKQVDVLKNNIREIEKDAEKHYSGLTKDQTASLIQELRCLEEKLDSAVQSKAFFKEQWGRAVRELHLVKLDTRRQLLQQLQQRRRTLVDPLDTIKDQEEIISDKNSVDINKLKDDFYVDLLANTPALDSHSVIDAAFPVDLNPLESYGVQNMTENTMKDKLGELIAERDKLVHQDSPDEDMLKQLNHEIRNMLINCGT